ncbi:MAG: hypothetical protein DRG78_02455 [Epsilonproteobacteria bacterium]|nr:MAG: hypothetical protein DRG78_02455 [Campylobacterota bacterium]
MKAVIALEELIAEGEAHLKLIKKQLSEHESGEHKLSQMVLASSETALVEVSGNLEKNTNMLKKFMQQDIKELEKQEKIREAIQRKNYYHFQKTRLNRNTTRDNDEKLEAMLIIDELPEDIGFEDDDLFRVAEESLKLHLSVHEDLQEKLLNIKKDFENAIKGIEAEDIKELGVLNFRIPILILQFSTLITNIKENIIEDNLPPFKGLPKFEDWWFSELWKSHQAYFGLYKWKYIISGLCNNQDQENAWEIISTNWISMKKFLSNKGSLAYKYSLAFDNTIRTHCGLEEELATTSLKSMERIIEILTVKEDFTKTDNNHKIVTPYVEFKREQLNYKDIKGKK